MERVLRIPQSLVGLIQSTLDFGSRQPTDAPTWVTLEVLHGGFASGKYLSELNADDKPNSEFLTVEGLRTLDEMLSSGCYRIRIPEHAALLTITWLIRNGCESEAKDLLQSISPWLDRLRFYPDAAETPLEISPLVSLKTVDDVCESLRTYISVSNNPAVRRCREIMAMKAAAKTWIPLKMRLFTLFLKTIGCGHAPEYSKYGHIDEASRKFVYEKGCSEDCGWPCQHYPHGWEDEARDLLEECDRMCQREASRASAAKKEYNHEYLPGCHFYVYSKQNDFRSSLNVFMRCLKACVKSELTGKQVGRLRQIMAGLNRKHGLPGSERYDQYYRGVSETVPKRNILKIAKLVLGRLKKFDMNEGLREVSTVLTPVDLKGVPHEIPRSIARKIEPASIGSVFQLLDRGIIKSSEVLGSVIPALTAQISSLRFEDPDLRRLFFALSVSFSHRRSLLLLNLESQVKLGELPWAECIMRRLLPDSRSDAAETLKLVVKVTMQRFPFSIFPNKLVKSLRQLRDAAGLRISLVDELAADIFEGRFQVNFVDAAKDAYRLLGNSLYMRYYGLDYERIMGSNPVDDFTEICTRRAGLVHDPTRWYSPAQNGKIIEQGQIITTHNIASLVLHLDIRDEIMWDNLAYDTWVWIVRSTANPPTQYIPRLRQRKDIAYAWRQLLLYVSLAASALSILDKMKSHLKDSLENHKLEETQMSDLHRRMIDPLSAAIAGDRIPEEDREYGWV